MLYLGKFDEDRSEDDCDSEALGQSALQAVDVCQEVPFDDQRVETFRRRKLDIKMRKYVESNLILRNIPASKAS
jgi:hypothetical protein